MRILHEAKVILRKRNYEQCVAKLQIIEHRVKKHKVANDGGLSDELQKEFNQVKRVEKNAYKRLSQAQTTLSQAA